MYDNDSRISPWLSDGGALGVDVEFTQPLSGLDGLGRRKKGKRRARVVRSKARPAAVVSPFVGRGVRITVGPRRAAALLAASRGAAAVPPSVVGTSAAANPPSFAPAPEQFVRSFNAAANETAAAEASVVPGGGDVALDTSAPGDLPADVDALVTAAEESGPDAPMDAETLEGLGKFRIGKAFKNIAKVALPIAATVGAGAIGGALTSRLASGAGRGAVSAAGSKVASAAGGSMWRDIGQDILRRVGDVLVDAAGNVVSKYSGGRWQNVPGYVGPVTPPPAQTSGGASAVPWGLVLGGAALFLLLKRK